MKKVHGTSLKRSCLFRMEKRFPLGLKKIIDGSENTKLITDIPFPEIAFLSNTILHRKIR